MTAGAMADLKRSLASAVTNLRNGRVDDALDDLSDAKDALGDFDNPEHLGQLFGFTWADVDELRTIAVDGPEDLKRLPPDPELTSIADRIEAILPPRED